MTFWCCCSCCALAPELFFTPSVFFSFWFDRRRLIELDGKSNDVLRCVWNSAGAGMADVAAASSPSPPRGPGCSCWKRVSSASHRSSLVPRACCYPDWLLSPAWLRSTLSPALRTFLRLTRLAVSSRPSLAPSALLWDFEGFAVLFSPKIKLLKFLLWYLFQKHLSKRWFGFHRVRKNNNNLKASLLN